MGNVETLRIDKEQQISRAKKRKRILFFYNRPIQVRYAATALAIIVGTICAYTYLLFNQLSTFMENQPNRMVNVDLFRSLIMQELVFSIVFGSVICMITAGAVAAVWAMLVTHRYEGPLVRVNIFLKKMAAGDYETPLTVRKNDEVQELVKNINMLREALKEKSAIEADADSTAESKAKLRIVS